MESITQVRLPDDFTEHDGNAVLSNLDRGVDESVMEEIKGKELFSRYAGWNFNGLVWWQNKQWHCEVWRYRSYNETFSADTLEEIMTLVSDKYGYD